MYCYIIPIADFCTHGEVVLWSSSVHRAGVVVVCVNGTWSKICGGTFNNNFASVVCSQLGYSQYGRCATSYYKYNSNVLNMR